MIDFIWNYSFAIRISLACVLSCYLSIHGYSKKSLDISGSIAAILVGFISFATSYRFGLILIGFYYVSSKLTKWKEDIKAKLESNYQVGGQRNWIQVLSNSILATIIAGLYWFYVGEDTILHVKFYNYELSLFDNLQDIQILQTYLWLLYLSHYAVATGDTWASELGILSKNKPRIVTSLFLREVPKGTNGGMSLIGTCASVFGGWFIGVLFVLFEIILFPNDLFLLSRKHMMIINFCMVNGLIGSFIDSLLGATLQATYYDNEKKCIISCHDIKRFKSMGSNVQHITGLNVLTNEQVNFVSILFTMMLSLVISPYLLSPS